MFEAAMQWRAEVQIDELYARRQRPVAERSPRDQLAARHFYGALLPTPTCDGAPVMLERLGSADLSGMVRESLVPLMLEEYTVYLERAFQAVREASRREKRLIRARIIVDCSGLSFSTLYNISVIKQVAAIGPPNYPEVSHTVDIIRAPWVFEKAWTMVKGLLPEHTRSKVRVLGQNFQEQIGEYLDVSRLPSDICGGPSMEPPPTSARQQAWMDMPEGEEKERVGRELAAQQQEEENAGAFRVFIDQDLEGQATAIPRGLNRELADL